MPTENPKTSRKYNRPSLQPTLWEILPRAYRAQENAAFSVYKSKSGLIKIYDYTILALTPLFLLIPLLPYLVKISWGTKNQA